MLNVIAVKLELFSNILLVLGASNFEYCGKVIHGVESSFTEYNLSIIEKVKSSSIECNPLTIKGVESSFM